MTTLEIRNQVISRINQITDDEILKDILKFINGDFINENIYNLSDKHKSAINHAIEQINNGEYLSNEQANQEMNEWLSK